MKTRIFTSLAIALLLIATLVMPAVATEYAPITASVTISSEIGVLITDTSGGGFVFGSRSAGATNILDTHAAAGTPSVTISVTGTSIVDLQVKGTDFGTGFPIESLKYYNSFVVGSAIDVTDTYTLVNGGNEVEQPAVVSLWFWLDVPASGVTAGAYSANITFQAIED